MISESKLNYYISGGLHDERDFGFKKIEVYADYYLNEITCYFSFCIGNKTISYYYQISSKW